MDTTEDAFWILREKHVNELPLLGSPLSVISIFLLYLLFILKIGPSYMKNRPAYDLKKVLIIYNAVLVVISVYITHILLNIIRNHGLFDKTCSTYQENFDKILYTGYCYFLTKIVELLDTVFFVLRKKQNQVTFLHVYHHSMMVVFVWVYLKFEPSYSCVILVTLNSIVHIVMYTYYGLAAIPAMRKFLWWKKYLTTMQLVQFALAFVHMIVFRMTTKCPLTYYLFTGIMINTVIFLYLFFKFYINSYLNDNVPKISIDNFVCAKVSEIELKGTSYINYNLKHKSKIKSGLDAKRTY